jgi:hypothetical protein
MFRCLDDHFESLEIGMTQWRKFKYLDEHYESLGTGMTQLRKFRNPQWTLLLILF